MTKALNDTGLKIIKIVQRTYIRKRQKQNKQVSAILKLLKSLT